MIPRWDCLQNDCNNHPMERQLVVSGKATTPSRVCIHNILKDSVYHIHPHFQRDSGKHAEKRCATWCFILLVQTKYMGMFKNKGRGFTMFMAYIFYLVNMWLKSCSSQIPFIPQCVASYHILNYPLVPYLCGYGGRTSPK